MRENTALETDIRKSGEVVVEGHVIGRLDGFTFTPEASSAGTDAKALAGAAQKVLAVEIDARASRLGKAPDEQFVLATDGVIRWQGQPVGKIMAAEEVLKPRVRIVADEQLTGGSEFTPIVVRGVRVAGKRPVISGGTNTVHFKTVTLGSGADHYVFEGFEVTGGTSRCIFHQSSDLTLRDLNAIVGAMVRALEALYHSRPQYPGRREPPGAPPVQLVADP